MIEGFVVVGTRNNYLPKIRGEGTHDALQYPALARLIKAAPASPSRRKGSLSFVSKIAVRATTSDDCTTMALAPRSDQLFPWPTIGSDDTSAINPMLRRRLSD